MCSALSRYHPCGLQNRSSFVPPFLNRFPFHCFSSFFIFLHLLFCFPFSPFSLFPFFLFSPSSFSLCFSFAFPFFSPFFPYCFLFSHCFPCFPVSLLFSLSFDILLGAAPSGLEALTRLVHRWHPLSGGKRRSLLRQISVPDRCKLQDLPAGLEKWEELVRRYQRSKSSGTTTAFLDVHVKTPALEALVPSALEQHLATNRARLITYKQVRSEIQAYTSSPPKSIRIHDSCCTEIFRSDGDEGSFVKGGMKGNKGKKGKGDSKNDKKEDKGENQSQNPNPSMDAVCWHCGEKGHLSTECWSNPTNQSGSGGNSNKGGKGKQKDGIGEGAGSLERREQAAVVEPQP